MATQLNPYLIFNGTTRQAMELYQSVLGGKLDILTFGAMGHVPEGTPADGVMHAYLESPTGLAIMASDGAPGDPVDEHGNSFAISISGDDAAEMRGYWEKFAAAGTIDVPLEKQMWGDEFGQITDPFKVAWMFNITGPRP